MIGEIAISPETAKIATKFLANNGEYLTSVTRSILGKATEEILLKSRHCYKKYLETSIEVNSKSRSFFFRNSPVNIYDFFVPMDIEYSSEIKQSANVNELLDINHHIIVQASAGYGKSVFLRHLFLTSIETCNFVPVLFDLRAISDDNYSLLEFLHRKMYDYGFRHDVEFLKRGLELGHFLLMLDGFDEISPHRREVISKEINSLSTNYSLSPIIVTSRPDNAFTSWEKFSLLSLSPLSQQAAIELVRKTPEEDELKNKFIEDLEKSLFDKHDTFLRNPLLLSIMVLTYTKSANVPTKISLFYDNAYHALFEGHDALKGGFQRQRKCKIDVLDFSKVFASYCIQTYSRQEYTISKIRALEVARNAIFDQKHQIEPNDFLDDCLQSVCLLVEDGLFVSFSHRSFQEYFVAKFVQQSPDTSKNALIENIEKNARYDSVLPILWEIDEYAFEKYYLIPRARELFKRVGLKSKVGYFVFVRFMKLAFSDIRYLRSENLNFRYSLSHRDSAEELWQWIEFVQDKFDFRNQFSNYTEDELKSLKRIFENDFKLRKDSDTISTKSISSRAEFWKIAFNSDTFLSQKWLQRIYEICLSIEQKHERRDGEIFKLIGSNGDD